LGIVSKFLGEFTHQGRVELILRFLNAKQWMRLWVMKQHQIRKHLYGSVRNIPVEERGLECAVAKSEDEVTVLGELRLDSADPRNPLLHPFKDFSKYRRVVYVKVLRNAGQILTSLR